MTTHLGAMAACAFFIALVFAVLARDEPADQLRLGLQVFGGLVGGAIAIGWLLYPLPF
jgi:hypothetical protein